MSLSPDELDSIGRKLAKVGGSLHKLGASLTELERVVEENAPALQRLEVIVDKFQKNQHNDKIVSQGDSSEASSSNEKNVNTSADSGKSLKKEKQTKSSKMAFPKKDEQLFINAWAAMQNCKEEKDLASNIRCEVSNLFYSLLTDSYINIMFPCIL